MSETDFSPGIDPPSPTLSARLRELADHLAAPASGRLTEEQRALALGIARRLVADVAARLDSGIDAGALWDEWLRGGLPHAGRLAGICLARTEEHRWREQATHRGGVPPIIAGPGAAASAPAADEPLTDIDRAYLALRIADRRRFDALGHPAIAVADLDEEIFRALLLDIAAWRLPQVSEDQARAARLGDAVRTATEQKDAVPGITDAGRDYFGKLGAAVPDAAAAAIARHDWPTLIALAAAASRRRHDDMALALLTSESAALPSLLAPLRLDHAAIAPLEASLAMLPARAVSGIDDVGHRDAGGSAR